MELVLLRHAKAEEDSAALPDERRELVAKGRKRAQAVAKGLERLLPADGRVEVWTSPALRSRQTAEIIAEHLGVETVTEHAAIYAGSLDNLLAEWAGAAGERTVIVVGHEPYLGIWARQLADVTLPFKKCAAAGFSIAAPDFSTGTLRWFAGPKVLTALGGDKG
ncbi:SixA phosphatase family protein [Anaeroselena agilis]|uniref:Histidine phosphatase family protein n=1 Tax=Anaeroselena agilis TaxID=3063788 RepID=A0ABU3P0B4_9FIRM|nr:histidine phosphatase family protein [Selenomonadales bacterium 4137-cl]